MPLHEFLCLDCGCTSEVLVMGSADIPECRKCGGRNLQKLISAHATHPVASSGRLPGSGDTGCCGDHPGHAGCAGPGSCCGRH